MANQWFRMYAEFANDPKVQMMSESDQRRLVMVLCMRCNGNVTLQDEEVAFQLRISNEDWLRSKQLFVSKGFIDQNNVVLNWDKRQFASDSSAARVARHRERKKQACNVTVTPQNRTDTEQNRTEQNRTEQIQRKDIAASPPPSPTKKLLVEFGVEGDLADDFIRHRKKCGRDGKEAPITKTAMEGFQREAGRAGIAVQEAVRISIEKGWRGFNADWDWGQKRRPDDFDPVLTGNGAAAKLQRSINASMAFLQEG